ncbi:MAG: GDSL-type esterase/lipase family protein [Paracoccus sp. (in: a-proteobacteria)]|uniref:GDSL-type esterase/lipase family protein n=1 Tax=Paracoccus sp. TaxID=267 RepID=UPI0026DEFC4D|nr:GDSL-type esterase/lipase family protein [Paracoccus sp. (in: a-proteobacteria)]MDO5622906.1 GDSL-type esterase/lipase family protein [Paracoccus sp. (in: a-proteobacteria)]
MNRVCFIGASTTEGMGDEEGIGWPGRLSRSFRQGTGSFNLGVRGQTVFQIADRAVAECRARLLDRDGGRIILGAAMNEMARFAEDGRERFARSDILGAYARLIDDLRELASLLVVGPAPVFEARMPFYSQANRTSFDYRNTDLKWLDAELRSICAMQSVPYISILPALIEDCRYQSGLARTDGLHPDHRGYAAAAEFIAEQPAWQEIIRQRRS